MSDDTPAWLKQRSAVLNSNNNNNNNHNNTKPTKVVDKELARLMNRGGVSSVWSNKFVQEDASVPRKNPIQIKSPTRDTFRGIHRPEDNQSEEKSRPLSNSSIKSTDSVDINRRSLNVNNTLSSQIETLKMQYDECHALLEHANKDVAYYKNQLQQEAEKKKEIENAGKDEAAQLWFQCETLKTEFAKLEARYKKANSDIEFYKQQLEDESEKIDQIKDSGKDEAATLWFQCETLKTQFAQLEARYKKANAEIESYQQQLKEANEKAKAYEDRGKDEAAALWFQSETIKTQFAQNEARLKKSIETYKQQLEEQQQEITRLSSEKENEIGHVHTLVDLISKQNQLIEEYESKVQESEQILKDSLEAKQLVQAELLDLRQELASLKQEKEIMETMAQSLRVDFNLGQDHMKLMMAISLELQKEHNQHKEKLEHTIQELLDKKEAELGGSANVDDLYHQIAVLKQTLAAKDSAIHDLENQLNIQKTTMDAQVMELTQTILEKDALLIEVMGSKNQEPSSPSHNNNSYYQEESQFEMSKVREFIYSVTDDEEEDDDHSEGLTLRYSTDDEVRHDYFNESFADAVSSPVDSTISFDSSMDEKDKHFSYMSAQSKPSRTVSVDSHSSEYKRVSLNVSKDAWPMVAPPTPPPNEPLPPVPADFKKRSRSKTMSRNEAPKVPLYQAPILPLQRQSMNTMDTNWMDDPESENDDMWHHNKMMNSNTIML